MSALALAGTEDHPQARMVLSTSLAAGPSHAYLFHGPAGTGKRTAARGLGVDEVAAVNALATGGLRPDLTLLLDLDPEAAHARAGEEDRFEAEGAELQQAVAAAYSEMADADPARWRRIPAARPPEEVHADVLAAVRAARAGAPA